MGRFNPEHEITIGCEFMAKTIKIKDRNIKVEIESNGVLDDISTEIK